MSKPAFLVEELTVNYDKTPALWDISFEVPKGKLAAVIGPNGAGKSTLLKATLGLIKPCSGKVAFFGQPLKKMRRSIAYIPQRESVDWDFPITVLDLVLMGGYGCRKFLSWTTKKECEEAKRLIHLVGLSDVMDRQISQLSGGQQQRAFLARALMQNAEIYFMDEPFTGIDSASMHTIVTILRSLRNSGKTIFVIHHDLALVPQIFDWAILINIRLVACGSLDQVFTQEMIQKTYGTQNILFGEASVKSQEKNLGFATE